MVTISDVANKVGVSIKTVSRVINEEPHVRASVRTKVQAAVEELGYTPNISARRLASSRSFLMTMLYDNPNNGYVMSILKGAMDKCRQLGYNMIVENLDAHMDDLGQHVADILKRSGSDGLILTPPFSDDEDFISYLQDKGHKIVAISALSTHEIVDNILINEERAAYEMTRHLMGLGHKRIGIIKGLADHEGSQLRFDGYKRALIDADIGIDDALVCDGNFSYREALKCTDEMLSIDHPPTAIFACNDEMAAAVLATAQKRQLDVPSDLAISGFDDTAIARTVWPSLTTIRQPFEEMAGEAARLLANKIGKASSEKARNHYLDYNLIIRESTIAED